MTCNNTVEETCLYEGLCSDISCQWLLTVSKTDSLVLCPGCGQKQVMNSLLDLKPINKASYSTWEKFLRRVCLMDSLPHRGTEMVKVLGLSNYYCKLLSPLLTKYGMDKETGRAKLLSEMNQGEIFDCSLFGDRAFLIEPQHVSIPGFGRDITGSMIYLSETLKLIQVANGKEERLIPIHADGDGHCLVHAISRALVGRELFWHPLRCCLKKHFEANLEKYKELFKDFIDTDEWPSIINECDPDFKPPEGELHGLRNIHIFGFANILKRPVILLDSYECMKKCGDYSGVFLPGFVEPEDCRGKDGSLNKPICIAWSSFSHNHYIPLVGVKGKPLPVLPSALVPTVWGMPQSQIAQYIELEDGNLTLGGGRPLTDRYIQRLVCAMEDLFLEQNKVHPSLVADVKYISFSNNPYQTTVATVIARAKMAVFEGHLFRCLYCKTLCELQIDSSVFKHGGLLYNSNLIKHGKLLPNTTYEIPEQGIFCKYNPVADKLIPYPLQCPWCCSKPVPKLNYDNTVIYEDGAEASNNDVKISDVNGKIATASTSDDFKFSMHWNERTIEDKISLADLTSTENKKLDSVADNIIHKHFSENIRKSLFTDQAINDLRLAIYKEILRSKQNNSSSNSLNYGFNKEKSTDVGSQNNTEDLTIQNKVIIEPQVKVVTSNGQEANLNIGKGISYPQLQEWIMSQFEIPVSKQRIKYGFPLKVLFSDSNNQILPLKTGDRLMVEIVQKGEDELNKENSQSITTISDFVPNIEYHSDLIWLLMKHAPESFEKDGAHYLTFSRECLLHHKMHKYLPKLPSKRFCYNPLHDRIEICVKSVGHFRICIEVDSKIERVKQGDVNVEGFSKCPLTTYQKEQKSNKNSGRTISNTGESKDTPLLRKGPGFSIITKPKSSDVEEMEL